jgi:hypothetical protein
MNNTAGARVLHAGHLCVPRCGPVLTAVGLFLRMPRSGARTSGFRPRVSSVAASLSSGAPRAFGVAAEVVRFGPRVCGDAA